jgi:eukaryotic-like serine/threonine-protein kinase
MALGPAPEGCLDPDTLAAYVDGRLAEVELDRADRHIDSCRSCRGELSALAVMHTGSRRAAECLTPTGRLGRYHLLRELGRGAMGVVIRAYDPELARAVALKVLGPVAPEARERLLHEAQVMARLRHPNVVGVYDVVVEGEAMAIAMELVEGDTLRGFLHARRDWRAVLDTCIRAGRGLAAAHAAQLVHRDFKPENVLCGEAGEVRVSDFGLAIHTIDAIGATGPIDDARTSGACAGTPAYMAPEILRREPATPASDQFSFCVTLFEALYGRRPFLGRSVGELRERIARGAIAPPRDSPVPAWIGRVIARGLAHDPAARYPSLEALLDALVDDRAARRRRWLVLAATLAAAAATGALAGYVLLGRHAQLPRALLGWPENR